MMRYPVSIYEHRHGDQILFTHPDDRDTLASVYLPTAGWWAVAWSDGTITTYPDRAHFEQMWVDYVTGGAAFTDHVRHTVRDELASLARS